MSIRRIDHVVEAAPGDYVDNLNAVGSTNYANYDTNAARPVYADEWQATREKTLPDNLKGRTLESG